MEKRDEPRFHFILSLFPQRWMLHLEPDHIYLPQLDQKRGRGALYSKTWTQPERVKHLFDIRLPLGRQVWHLLLEPLLRTSQQFKRPQLQGLRWCVHGWPPILRDPLGHAVELWHQKDGYLIVPCQQNLQAYPLWARRSCQERWSINRNYRPLGDRWSRCRWWPRLLLLQEEAARQRPLLRQVRPHLRDIPPLHWEYLLLYLPYLMCGIILNI